MKNYGRRRRRTGRVAKVYYNIGGDSGGGVEGKCSAGGAKSAPLL